MFKAPEIPRKQLTEHSAFIREIGLCMRRKQGGHWCNGKIESCHIRLGSNAGLGRKPVGREVPLCQAHHRLQHAKGELSFWGDKLERAIEAANALWLKTGDIDYGRLLVARFL